MRTGMNQNRKSRSSKGRQICIKSGLSSVPSNFDELVTGSPRAGENPNIVSRNEMPLESSG